MSETSGKITRTRRWCFTINNPEATKDEVLKSLQERASVRYAIIGREVGEVTETEHLQGFVEFENAATFEQMKARLPRAHIEQALGSNRQNRAYCAKGGDFVEVGSLVHRVQTSQEAQEVVRLIIEEGYNPLTLAVEYQEYSAYIVNHFHALQAMHREAYRLRLGVETFERKNKDDESV